MFEKSPILDSSLGPEEETVLEKIHGKKKQHSRDIKDSDNPFEVPNIEFTEEEKTVLSKTEEISKNQDEKNEKRQSKKTPEEIELDEYLKDPKLYELKKLLAESKKGLKKEVEK